MRRIAMCLLAAATVQANVFIAKDGKATSEIVIAENATRGTHLAAQELQIYVAKISGAKLTIVTAPTNTVPVKLYVGQSPHTERLGITTAGLTHGAYRIVSGENWMVFIGDDTEFTPIEPWPRGYADIRTGKMQEAWNKITGENWGYMHSQLHKHYSGPNALFGTPKEQQVDKAGNVNVWTYDERGSFNAVDGFLRDLGVRWYMPGEIGEVLPEMKTIPVPQVDKTVHPDFPMRILNFRASVYGHDAMMWGFRLGTRRPYGRQAAHGLAGMTRNGNVRAEHPEWFALYGGKRQVDPRANRCYQLCYSNEELLREAVKFAQIQFDHFDMDVVSIMPPDGYTAICQCKLCEGKESPQLGERGRLSNYIWEFVNRVAKEVRKTHPDKMISNCAYGVYTNAPDNIDKLEPNVQVIIVGGRRPTRADRDKLRKLRAAWATKTDNPLEIFENYPFTGRGFYLPAYIPRVMGEGINEVKGQARGEDVWITMDFKDGAIGYNHFLLYFTARMYWGGKDQDAVAMFDEYVRLFYGPAAPEMAAFFSYCETNWRDMEKDVEKAARALTLFDVAKAEVGPADSVYAKRIQLIDNYLKGLRSKRVQLAQTRGPVPKLRLVSGSRTPIVVDGKLDDHAWKTCAVASTGRMRELQTGRQPIYGTSIKSAWIGRDLCFAIRCKERPGEKPNIATTKDNDQAIWYGDALEILVETDSHSYYQIAVGPSCALIDLDRGTSRDKWFRWSSQAEVATEIGDGYWTLEIRIPVTPDENDPNHKIVGRRPTQSLPWHINVCRQRIRENGSELSAFSPTSAKVFHKKMKFAHFYAGHSHRFDVDPTVTDHIIAGRKARALTLKRKVEDAIAVYLELAGAGNATEFQKSDALVQAATCARSLRDHARAGEFAEQIPIDAVKKTVQIENLVAQRRYAAVIEQFGAEDLNAWPFWQRGAGAFARAKAYYAKQIGDQAEADLQLAAAYTSERRARTSILTMMGDNRQRNLKDDAGALEAYRENYEGKNTIGAADEFRALQGAARILAKQGRFDEALATIRRANIDRLKGVWRHAMLISLGDALAAADRKDEALAAYRKVLADEGVLGHHRRAAEKALRKLAGE